MKTKGSLRVCMHASSHHSLWTYLCKCVLADTGFCVSASVFAGRRECVRSPMLERARCLDALCSSEAPCCELLAPGVDEFGVPAPVEGHDGRVHCEPASQPGSQRLSGRCFAVETQLFMSCQTAADSIATGVVGVSLLLLVYFLNLFGYLHVQRWPDSAVYASLNAIGSGLSAVASGLIRYWPFVVLEGVWCLTSLAGLGRILYRHWKGNHSTASADGSNTKDTG
jgi:hypothetical protein